MPLGDSESFTLGFKAAQRMQMRSLHRLQGELGVPVGGQAWGEVPFGGDAQGTFAVFYSPPRAIAGASFFIDRAAEQFARFDAVIWPGQVPLAGISGIENPSNAFYADSKDILDAIRLINPNTLIYGYIPMDLPYSNLTLTQIQTSVTQCAAFGYDGIFWDTCGSEFGNTRARQNACVAMTHAATNSRRPGGLLSILNGFDPNDIYNSAVNTNVTPTNYPGGGAPGDAGGLQINPTGADPLVYPGDGILAESFAVNTDPSASPYGWPNGWQNIVTMLNKQYYFSVYRLAWNIKVFGIAVMPPQTFTPYTRRDALEYANFAQAMSYIFALDYFGYGTQNYGGADQIIPVFTVMRPFGRLDYYLVQPFWTATDTVLNAGGAIIKTTLTRLLYGSGVYHYIQVMMDDTTVPPTRNFRYLDSNGVSLYGGVSEADDGFGVTTYKPGNNYGAFDDLARHAILTGQELVVRRNYMPQASTYWLSQYSGATKISEFELPIELFPRKASPMPDVKPSVAPGGVIAYFAGDGAFPEDAYVYQLSGVIASASGLARLGLKQSIEAALVVSNRLEKRYGSTIIWIPLATVSLPDNTTIHGAVSKKDEYPHIGEMTVHLFAQSLIGINATTGLTVGTF